MKVTITFHDGSVREFENVERVVEKDKYRVCLYGQDDCILAILSHGDVKTLLTDDQG